MFCSGSSYLILERIEVHHWARHVIVVRLLEVSVRPMIHESYLVVELVGRGPILIYDCILVAELHIRRIISWGGVLVSTVAIGHGDVSLTIVNGCCEIDMLSSRNAGVKVSRIEHDWARGGPLINYVSFLSVLIHLLFVHAPSRQHIWATPLAQNHLLFIFSNADKRVFFSVQCWWRAPFAYW